MKGSFNITGVHGLFPQFFTEFQRVMGNNHPSPTNVASADLFNFGCFISANCGDIVESQSRHFLSLAHVIRNTLENSRKDL